LILPRHGEDFGNFPPLTRSPDRRKNPISSRRHNPQAGEDHRGSSDDNMRQQEQESRNPDKSNARDRTGRKGGSNERNR